MKKQETRPGSRSRSLLALFILLLLVIFPLGYHLMYQASSATITLMRTRMLDISNTAAAMLDGDALKAVTPADEGTPAYDAIMKTLMYFQDNIDLKYIYCIHNMGDGTFTFGLDPSSDPGEFGSPIVYTDALYRASQGAASADETPYQDAWGTFYSAYSPVFDSQGQVAGIVAVDFSADWYDQQLANLTRTMIVMALLALVAGGGLVITIIARSERRMGFIQGRLNEMASTLMQEMGNPQEKDQSRNEDAVSMDTLERQIQSMQTELQSQIAQVHDHAYRDGLTGVKSKQAYLDAEKMLDEKIARGALSDFALVVCDVNGLKRINDTQGHKAGDEYILKACKMVCDIFAHSPVYRVGGDEFIALLTGRDFESRNMLVHELHRLSSAHITTHEAIVSGGMAEYIPGQDHSIRDVFERADATMYKEKMLLKSLGAVMREEEATEQDPAQNSIRVRKHILIADDIESNREILGDLLEDDYDILYATNGVEALKTLRSRKDEIALLILDLYMPEMTGREVMTEMQVDGDLMSIPIIVLTVDQNAELDCLKLGAMDFISKPYPDIEIVKARIAKCIELSEYRDLIRHTERDRLTGLFNVDYFFRYVDRFDQQYRDAAFDAFVCDIDHFYSINEQYGQQFGDLVLHSIGASIRKLARKTGGICCRQRGDTFLIYCPHRDDYEQLATRFMADLFVEKDTAKKVTLRFGVYADARREPDIEERFVRAKIAADSVKNDPQRICGFYEY